MDVLDERLLGAFHYVDDVGGFGRSSHSLHSPAFADVKRATGRDAPIVCAGRPSDRSLWPQGALPDPDLSGVVNEKVLSSVASAWC
jgi:hypothetical protein